TPRRVKVYLLSGEDWKDNGTGYCTGELDSVAPRFVVRNELDASEILLNTVLDGDTQYQRQQDTLIVWTDPAGNDIALSFQEAEGCNSLCDFIIDMHEKYSSNISLVQVVPGGMEGADITELIVGPMNYPPPVPTTQSLEQVLEPIGQGSNSVYTREHMAKFLIDHDYILKLVGVFESAEQRRDLKSLHLLCRILKTLTLYNETSIIEIMIEDKVIMGVCGIFEYDPDFPTHKANHREYLADESKFKEVVELTDSDAEIKSLIKNNFRLLFLKDVIMARLLDDATLTLMNTLIYFNQVEIISFLKDSVTNPNMKTHRTAIPTTEVKRNGVRMLHQFTLITKSLQPNQKSDFFRLLVQKGLFKMLGFGFKDELTAIRVNSVELIVAIIEHDVLLVNGCHPDDASSLKLSNNMSLISILSDLMINEANQGLKIQAFEALKLLLDPAGDSSGSSMESLKTVTTLKTDEYFKAFYAIVAPRLFQPIVDVARQKPLEYGYSMSRCLLYQQLCELIAFCTREHDKNMCRVFFLENSILLGVSKLVEQTTRLQLRLAGIRCLKHIIFLNDDIYTRHVIANNLLAPIFQLLEETNRLNNLANSTCLDLIEQVLNGLDRAEHKKNFKLLATYIVGQFKGLLTSIDYVSNGSELVTLVEN
ncbi:hypothetical protein BABINDRAFT_25004, partial [Babjeviella inositovora NRRL Y-12698]